MNKHELPTIANFNLKVDLERLQQETDKLAAKFVDVRTANPMLCDNHMELVKSVYDNFEQINLTEIKIATKSGDTIYVPSSLFTKKEFVKKIRKTN